MRAETWFWRVKAAQRDLIARCGGIARAAEIAGCSPAWIGKCNNPNEEDDAFLSAVQKRRLEEDAAAPIVTRLEADILGFRLEPIAPASAHADGTPFEAHAAVLVEVADLARSFAQSVTDGVYSRADSVAVGRALSELRREIERFERVNAVTMAGAPAGERP